MDKLKNLISGFKNSGVHPYDVSPLLGRLQSSNGPNEINEGTSVADSFIEYLEKKKEDYAAIKP